MITNQSILYPGNHGTRLSAPGRVELLRRQWLPTSCSTQDPNNGIDCRSLVTGGMINPGQPVSSDPLFGKPIELIGDLFGDPEASRPAG